MLLRSLKLSGWRSFAPQHPAEISTLGTAILLIGPNNVGKSNLGRFLVRLRDILQRFRNVNPWAEGMPFRAPMAVSFEIEEIDHWLREATPIEAEIGLAVDALGAPQPLPSMLLSGDAVRFQIRMSATEGQGSLSVFPLTHDGKPVFVSEGGAFKLLLEDGSYTDRVTAAHTHRGLALAACQLLAEAIIEIKPLRDPMRKSARQRDRTTDGGDIIEALQSRQNDPNQQGFWTKFKADMQAWFAILLGEQDIRIDINDSGFWIEATRGDSSLRSALPDLGAGVSEVLMMLAYLRLHRDQQFLVIIDEPEAHLHPGAVVQLIRIITTYMPKHQLFITTHSTALVDAVTPEWSTFRVRRAPHHGTAIEMLNTTKTELALLADLGVRPSQLFLARVSLWVEGPSDVHYWTALLREVDHRLIPGRDFTFVTYGGASSSHLSFTEDEERDQEIADQLVQVLTVSHRAAIICDRDRPANEEDRPLVKRLIEAAQKVPEHARLVTSIGREIENDVRSDVLQRVLDEVRPKSIRKPNEVQLCYVDYTIGQDDAFDDVVAKAARTQEGTLLEAAQFQKVKMRLNQSKHEIAQRVREIGLVEAVFRKVAVKQAQELVTWLVSDPSGG